MHQMTALSSMSTNLHRFDRDFALTNELRTRSSWTSAETPGRDRRASPAGAGTHRARPVRSGRGGQRHPRRRCGADTWPRGSHHWTSSATERRGGRTTGCARRAPEPWLTPLTLPGGIYHVRRGGEGVSNRRFTAAAGWSPQPSRGDRARARVGACTWLMRGGRIRWLLGRRSDRRGGNSGRSGSDRPGMAALPELSAAKALMSCGQLLPRQLVILGFSEGALPLDEGAGLTRTVARPCLLAPASGIHCE
jgi:hypothetical protein